MARRVVTRRRRRVVAESPAPDETTPEPAVPDTTETQPSVVATEEVRPSGPPPLRIALIAGTSTLAAAIMVGGIFIGATPIVMSAIAGFLGIVLAVRVARVQRPLTMYVLVVLGIIAIAFLITLPSGFSHVLNISRDIREASKLGNVLRPPVDFLPGWRPILGLLMGTVGFAAAWAGLEMRRPALGLAIPIPIVAIAAISVPESQQLAFGLVALALFGVGLGILSGTESEGGGRVSLAYELRRAVRAIPLIGVITLVMYALAQTGFLFPEPLYDPAQEAQRPKAVPLTEVEDRVLFRVESPLTGPWRTGSLDVFDGKDWRLAPFARQNFVSVPVSGVVDEELQPGVRAEIEIAGLSGAVLPGLSNIVGVVAEGPKLLFDKRTQNIRLKQGQAKAGLLYTLIGPQPPSVQSLRVAPLDPPADLRQFTAAPEPPPVMQAFIQQARAEGKNRWDQLDYLRKLLLRTVIASGSGQPVPVPPERVVSMLTTQPESTPFEIVAAQSLLARWVGVPSRIGYGFDGGDRVEGKLEVHPRHGATWLEVYFSGHKWIPVIGQPLRAKTSLVQKQQQESKSQASSDIAVQLYFPTQIPPPSQLIERIRSGVLIALPIVLGLLFIYYTWPAVRKLYARNRRRTWALRAGPEARIAVAYAEWRDRCTDFGFSHSSDTPLMFLERVVPDEEHIEFAWLVTRSLWGDLRGEISRDDATAAEELSKSLQRRLSQTQTWVMRMIAAISRLSLRHPYAAELGIPSARAREREVIEVGV